MAKLYESRDWLFNRYILKKMTIVQIAEEVGCSAMTIQRYLEKFSLLRKS